MCDTMVILPASSASGHMLFAKNSDRSPNEPHVVLAYPAARHRPKSMVRCTYIEIPQKDNTYAVVLCKPSWIWGAEMGWNEHGLHIGNEAVFTKESKAATGLTGMDMLRLALERCATAREAVDCITELIAAHGQGGNCGYDHRFTYHNSFIMADHQSAWVLETAGKFWAAKQLRDNYAISNALTIGTDFDLIHPDAQAYALRKRRCKGEFDFAQAFTDPVTTAFSGAAKRRASVRRRIERDGITVTDLMDTMRSHDIHTPFDRQTVASVCMHYGGMVGDHTTGSMVAELCEQPIAWLTAASTPCIAAFKPCYEKTPAAPIFRKPEDALAYWMTREELHRAILQGRIDNAAIQRISKKRDEMEYEWMELYRKNPDDLDLQFRAYKQEMKWIQQAFTECSIAGKRRGGLAFRQRWAKKDRLLKQKN